MNNLLKFIIDIYYSRVSIYLKKKSKFYIKAKNILFKITLPQTSKKHMHRIILNRN